MPHALICRKISDTDLFFFFLVSVYIIIFPLTRLDTFIFLFTIDLLFRSLLYHASVILIILFLHSLLTVELTRLKITKQKKNNAIANDFI